MRYSGVGYKTGWMNSELFVEVIKHYILCSNSSKDNYQSHLSTEVTDVAKDKGVIILTPPPSHTHFEEISTSGCGVILPTQTTLSFSTEF
jgi:hypothetical protein